MGVGRSYCVALVGLNGYIVEVEADIGQTLPNFVILGLPDAALNEAKERIRSAAKIREFPSAGVRSRPTSFPHLFPSEALDLISPSPWRCSGLPTTSAKLAEPCLLQSSGLMDD